MNKDELIKATILGEEHLGENLKGLCIEYIDNLRQQNQKYKEVIDKAVLELVNIDGDLSNSQLSDRICNLIDILKEVE